MNGLPVAFYTYNGTQTGEHDPWTPKPKQARKPAQPQPGDPPCGTHAAYGRHQRRGEKCEPCWEVKRQYDRDRRASPEAKARASAYNKERYRRKKEGIG